MLCEEVVDFSLLIARSRATIARSQRLRAQARAAVARSTHLAPTAIAGASDVNGAAARDGHPHPGVSGPVRRSVLVLASDPVMRAFVADAIGAHHHITEASDVPEALKAMASAVRIDVIVAGCFMLGEGALGPCLTVARELYDACPWMPVTVIADTPPATLKADLLLTGVRTFLPKDFTPAELSTTIARIARRPDAPAPTSARVAAIKQTFSVLERAITDVPPLTALAAMVAMSRSHFSRTFHAVAGISLRDYVRDLRLKRAQELMRASRLSLSAIAIEAGFYDLPHFNKAFRHRFGMSPTQFRLASLSSHASSAA